MTPPEPISASSGWANTTMADSGTSVTISSLGAVWSGMSSILPGSGLGPKWRLRVVDGRENRGQRGEDLLETPAHPRDGLLRLLRNAPAGDVADDLLPAGRHQERRVDLELERVDAPGGGPTEGGHDVAAG